MAINNKEFYDVDYENIKIRLKEFLSQQTILKDYNFEGSAISNWLNLVCYVIYYIMKDCTDMDFADCRFFAPRCGVPVKEENGGATFRNM